MSNQQVKQVIQNFPYHLGDCIIIKVIPYADSFLDNLFEIYRVKLMKNGEPHYLDIVTNASQKFLGLGSNYHHPNSSFDISKRLCESLALYKHLEEKV